MSFNEIKQHGTSDFAIELYRLNEAHPKYEMVFHYHRELELVRVLRGELHLSLDSRAHSLQAGETAIINSEVVHGATPKEGCLYQCIVFSPLLILPAGEAGRFLAEGVLDQSLWLPERPEERLSSAVHGVFDALEGFDGENRLGVLSALFGLFHRIKCEGYYRERLPMEAPKTPKNLHKLKKALSFMREHYDSPLSLGDIAEAAGTSPKYLCSFFKELTGETPFSYLMSYRIERATRKLLSTDLSVTQIAYSCGFNDLSYFIKTFKAFKGSSPALYRQKERRE